MVKAEEVRDAESSQKSEDAKYGELIPMEVDSEAGEIRESVRDAISTLPVRERQILDFRFGLSDGFPRTLEETGKMFGVTRERIRQIQAKALSMLRRRIHKPLQEPANDAVDDDIERLLAGQTISAARFFN